MSSLQRLLHGDRRDPREALTELFGAPTTSSGSGSAPRPAVDWGRAELARRRIDPAQAPVAAIRALRRAEPRLALRPARYLVADLGRS